MGTAGSAAARTVGATASAVARSRARIGLSSELRTGPVSQETWRTGGSVSVSGWMRGRSSREAEDPEDSRADRKIRRQLAPGEDRRLEAKDGGVDPDRAGAGRGPAELAVRGMVGAGTGGLQVDGGAPDVGPGGVVDQGVEAGQAGARTEEDGEEQQRPGAEVPPSAGHAASPTPATGTGKPTSRRRP